MAALLSVLLILSWWSIIRHVYRSDWHLLLPCNEHIKIYRKQLYTSTGKVLTSASGHREDCRCLLCGQLSRTKRQLRNENKTTPINGRSRWQTRRALGRRINLPTWWIGLEPICSSMAGENTLLVDVLIIYLSNDCRPLAVSLFSAEAPLNLQSTYKLSPRILQTNPLNLFTPCLTPFLSFLYYFSSIIKHCLCQGYWTSG